MAYVTVGEEGVLRLPHHILHNNAQCKAAEQELDV